MGRGGAKIRSPHAVDDSHSPVHEFTGVGKLDDSCLLRASCAVSFKPSEETTLRTYPRKLGLRYPHNSSPEEKKRWEDGCGGCELTHMVTCHFMSWAQAAGLPRS